MRTYSNIHRFAFTIHAVISIQAIGNAYIDFKCKYVVVYLAGCGNCRRGFLKANTMVFLKGYRNLSPLKLLVRHYAQAARTETTGKTESVKGIAFARHLPSGTLVQTY